MAQANDGFARNPDSGGAVNLATHLIGGKEYPVIMDADDTGHIKGSTPAYLLTQMPRATTAAATDFFDIFNATGSGLTIRIRGLWLVKQVTAASAIVPFFEFHAIMTSAVGTGGTAASIDPAAAPAAGLLALSELDSANPALPAGITARALPAGGATAARFLWPMYFSNEETYPWAEGSQFFNLIPELAHDQPITVREGQGFKVRQITATASTGTNYGWMLAFTTV